ncbi:Kif4 [Symbiodinium natans]|uniref:Kif4 protein n=1 Tax=Symbiodinium natans TaxID=878477 RepID=A0A812KS45_9DINO|nr:Kif4 [Symbiodinium natans]
MPADEKARQVSVAVRLRGDVRGEAFAAEAARLDDLRAGDSWHFDHVYQPSSTNSELFETSVQHVVAGVCRGTGGIVLAGGVAEAGRILTGKGDDDSLVGRAVQQIFDEICSQRSRRYMLHVSYLEMTSTRMWDLLAGGREVKLDDRHRAKEISRRVVRHGPEDISECLSEGNQCRGHANLAKELAAGSHSVFVIDMGFRSASETKTQKSTLTFVDLDGLDSAPPSEAGREPARRNLSFLGRSLRRLSGPLWALLRRPLEASLSMALICSISTGRRGYAQSRRVVDAAALWVTQGEEDQTAEQTTIRELEGQVQALQAELAASVPRCEVLALTEQVQSLERQQEDLRGAYAAAVKRAEDAERRLKDATKELEGLRLHAKSETAHAPEPPSVTPAKEPRPRRSRAAVKVQPAWQDLIGLNQPVKRRRREEEEEMKPEKLLRGGAARAPAAPAESCKGAGPCKLPAAGAAPRVEAQDFARPSAEERMEALLAENARGGAPAPAPVTPARSQPATARRQRQAVPPLLALPPPPGLPSGASPTPPDPSPPRRRRRRSQDLSDEAAKAALAEAEAHQAKIHKLQEELAKRRQGMQVKRPAPALREVPLESPKGPAKPAFQAPMPKILPKPDVKEAARGMAPRVDAPSESEVALSELRERLRQVRQRGEAVEAANKHVQASAVRLSGGGRAAAPTEA